MSVPLPSVLRYEAECYVRSVVKIEGRVPTCAHLYHGAETDTIYANADEPWPTFVDFAVCEMKTLGGFAVTFFKQFGTDVRVMIMHKDAPPIELSLSTASQAEAMFEQLELPFPSDPVPCAGRAQESGKPTAEGDTKNEI